MGKKHQLRDVELEDGTKVTFTNNGRTMSVDRPGGLITHSTPGPLGRLFGRGKDKEYEEVTDGGRKISKIR